MINHDGVSTLDALVNNLGLSEACEFLETSLPEITRRKNILQQSLRSGNFPEAVECARNSLGSIRFFGSAKLETTLLQISNNQIDASNAVELQRKLSREFESVIRTIKAWLAENKPTSMASDTTHSSPSVEL